VEKPAAPRDTRFPKIGESCRRLAWLHTARLRGLLKWTPPFALSWISCDSKSPW